MIIAGIALLVASGVLYLLSALEGRKLAAMAGTPTSLAADLKALASSVGGEIGAGSFAEAAEVKGAARCGQPLVSELAEVPCVHYSAKVSREYEETVWETDSNGRRVQRTHRGSEVVSQNARSVPFEVEDSSGRIRVDPDGAKIDAERVLSRFEPGEAAAGFRLGRFVMGAFAGLSTRRTIGYRYEEHAIPVDRVVYVLGEASDAGGSLSVRRPAVKAGRFIISVKSEEELTRRASQAAAILRWTAIAADAAGVGLIVAGVLTS